MSQRGESVTALRKGLLEMVRPGQSDLPGRTLWNIGSIFITVVIVATNFIGAVAVLVIAAWVVPTPPVADTPHVRLVNAVAAAIYVLLAIPTGTLLGVRGLRHLKQWMTEDRPATSAEMRSVLRAPIRLFLVQVSLWLIAALAFAILNATYSVALGLTVAIVITTTGVVTASSAYLLTEIAMRPAAARALAHGAPERLVVPGVATRSVLAWVLGTGVTTAGMVEIGILALAGVSQLSRHPSAGVEKLGISMVVLGGTGFAVGLIAVILVARITADPIDSVRRALARVQRGDLDVSVPVFDGTQTGQLQLGFNEMVAGLKERERIREVFGTYVDPDVAEHILHEQEALTGLEVEVTLMFVDIRDFTGFSERTSAEQVVAAINELFEQIVPIVHAHGGRVDKFIGDGLLAVFGAPRRQADHADQALAAALEIASRVRSRNDLRLGLGLNSGLVVAGNVGGAGRFEFSVIGDPVNVASRVEAATRLTGDSILVAHRTTELLAAPHPALVERHGVELKGKSEPVRLYAPDVSGAERSAINEVR
jgi:adenylate cyclase